MGIVEEVSKSVKEKVSLSCGYNFSPEEQPILRIYWQKHDKMVLSVISGVQEVWPEYKNRTLHDNTTYSLIILGLVLSDRGTYKCVVQKIERGVYEVKHLASVKLSIKADFPTPNITECGNPSADTKRISCFASGGFPEPRLSWLENGRELNGINTTVSQDPKSELYTIRSQLDFNTTYNHSIECFIAYGDAYVSENFTWEKPPEDPPDKNDTTVDIMIRLGTSIGAVIIFIIIVGSIYCSCCRRRNEASRETNGSLYIGPAEASAEQTGQSGNMDGDILILHFHSLWTKMDLGSHFAHPDYTRNRNPEMDKMKDNWVPGFTDWKDTPLFGLGVSSETWLRPQFPGNRSRPVVESAGPSVMKEAKLALLLIRESRPYSLPGQHSEAGREAKGTEVSPTFATDLFCKHLQKPTLPNHALQTCSLGEASSAASRKD
ncbi:T-lymphocyte activation antigen CD80 [Apodemus speciosus]|uniref:T-lymphocyte activation antigen CD80 n=1 Tax=Apodemus speciosus TaxID=105296 RepID=A0ABQ0FM41_APOSI